MVRGRLEPTQPPPWIPNRNRIPQTEADAEARGNNSKRAMIQLGKIQFVKLNLSLAMKKEFLEHNDKLWQKLGGDLLFNLRP